MANYISDGKQLLDAEYDAVIEVGDTIDNMRVLSTNEKSKDEFGVFLLQANGEVSCYVFDEIFIVGRVTGFENLPDAIEAWVNDEV